MLKVSVSGMECIDLEIPVPEELGECGISSKSISWAILGHLEITTSSLHRASWTGCPQLIRMRFPM